MRVWCRSRVSSPLALVLVAALLLFSGAPAAAQGRGPDHPESYKIGYLMPLTGGYGKNGNLWLQAVNLAVEEINGQGGVNGRPIKVILEDSRGLAKEGVDGFQKLVDVDGVKFIITGFTAVAIAIAPLSKNTKTFMLSASTASPALRGISPYFFSGWMYDDETIKLLLPYAKRKLGINRLAVMTVMTDLGTGLSAAAKKVWAEVGGEFVGEGTHQLDAINFRPTLIKLLAQKPDAIYITTSAKEAALIVKQARDLGFKGAFLSYGALEQPDILAIADKAEGSYYSAPVFDPASDDRRMKAFEAAFKKKYHDAPNLHHANHYDLVQMFKLIVEDVYKQGKPYSGEALRDAFRRNVREYRGTSGSYRFNLDDGSVLRPSILKTVKDGKFVKVDTLQE